MSTVNCRCFDFHVVGPSAMDYFSQTLFDVLSGKELDLLQKEILGSYADYFSRHESILFEDSISLLSCDDHEDCIILTFLK